MGFWHTGYAEFHESTGLDDHVYKPPPPIRYGCEHCSASFDTIAALRRHRFEEHPVRRPLLLIRGKPVGGLPLKLFTALQPTDVVVEEAERCRLNEGAVASRDLGRRLAALRDTFVVLELANGSAISRFKLDFRVAKEADLRAVETAFLRLARERELSVDAVSRFVQECERYPSGMAYCDGICHYLYGVMAKEQAPDSGLRADDYAERYLLAAEELASFERSLARSVRSLIAFHFNHFDESERLAPEGGLKHAAGAYANLVEGVPWHYDVAFEPRPGGAVEDLLTDQDTLLILEDTSRGLVQLKAMIDQLTERLKRMPVGHDRLKRALLTAEALAARDDEESHVAARRLARELSTQPATQTWGAALLQRLM